MIWELGQDAAEESISLLRWGGPVQVQIQGVSTCPGPARLAGTQVGDVMLWRHVKHDQSYQLYPIISLFTLPHTDSLHFLQSSWHDTPQRTFCYCIIFIHRIPPMFHCVAALATADLACLAQLGHTRNRSKLQVFQCSLRVVAVPEGLPKKLT